MHAADRSRRRLPITRPTPPDPSHTRPTPPDPSHTRPKCRQLLACVVVVALAATGCGPLVTVHPRGHVELPAPPQTSVILDASGAPLARLHADQNREVVPLSRIPVALRQAVVAVEDTRFYAHGGVDAPAVIRALLRNSAAGAITEGGSTITQQLAKNVVVGAERSLNRKAAEASVALQLEAQLSKDAILERYLNAVSFGRGAYGVQAAARTYFGADVAALDLAQSALLAALPRSPAAYDPVARPEAARDRRNRVLAVMADQGVLTQAAAATAQAAPLGVRWAPEPGWRAPAFVAHVLDVVRDDPGFAALGADPVTRSDRLLRGGLRVETTLDPNWQAAAEQAVARTLDRPGDPSAAVAAIDPGTGGIRALVSGRNEDDGQVARGFNLATQARRQPGSAFKAVVLAAALGRGRRLDETFPGGARVTVPTSAAGGWRVENADGVDFGPLTLRAATAYSVNVVYARLVAQIGPEAVVRTGRALGVRSALRPYPALALGAQEVTPLEMAGVMATLAAGGVHRAPTAITRILGPDGAVLYERPEPVGERMLDEEVAWHTTSALQTVVERGTGVRANLRRPLAGKTGTTQDGADAWFTGYTPDLAAAVWIGFPQGRVAMVPPRTRVRVEGGTWPAELFARFGFQALAAVPAHPFVPPRMGPGAILADVPDVVGLPLHAGARLLDDAGVRVTTRAVHDELRPPGYVVAQSSAGRRVPAGSTVELSVSAALQSHARRSLARARVPDVLGADQATGRAQLDRAGLAAQVVPGCPGGSTGCTGAAERPGQVWQMQPDAGAAVPAGSPVRLFIYPPVSPR